VHYFNIINTPKTLLLHDDICWFAKILIMLYVFYITNTLNLDILVHGCIATLASTGTILSVTHHHYEILYPSTLKPIKQHVFNFKCLMVLVVEIITVSVGSVNVPWSYRCSTYYRTNKSTYSLCDSGCGDGYYPGALNDFKIKCQNSGNGTYAQAHPRITDHDDLQS